MAPHLRAALWMIGAIGSFTSMAIAGRAVSSELDTFEIMFYRSLMGICIVVAVAARRGTLGQVSRAKFGLHLLRNIAHFTGQNLWFFAITVIPLAQVFALEFTMPIWVILLSPFLLGERLTGAKLLAATIGLAGILIVSHPTPDTLNLGIAAAALAACGIAPPSIFTRRLSRT